MNQTHQILMIVVSAAVTMLLRFMPFLVFGGKKQPPRVLHYLSGVLPYAVMAMLVVYCLRNVTLFAGSRGLPEAIAVFVVIFSYVWKRNTLISITVGTILYMVLVQMVF